MACPIEDAMAEDMPDGTDDFECGVCGERADECTCPEEEDVP